eukprot:gene11050-7683_t
MHTGDLRRTYSSITLSLSLSVSVCLFVLFSFRKESSLSGRAARLPLMLSEGSPFFEHLHRWGRQRGAGEDQK